MVEKINCAYYIYRKKRRTLEENSRVFHKLYENANIDIFVFIA